MVSLKSVMKIAFLNKYQNKVARGAETYVYELSKRLSKNHKVDVISNINYGALLRNKYDVIVPTNGRLQAIIARKIAWLTGAKVIISGQSGIGWDDRINLYVFPNIFVALSTKALNWAKKVNPFVKSVYIPNGVDLQKFSPDGPSLRPGLKKPLVLCVGALTEQKRIDLVIKAVAKMNNVSLLVAGSGPLKDHLCQLGEKLLGERFELISVSYADMPQVYRCADVFTLASESSESFGNVFVEAMASGLPVVARDDEQRKEIVGDAGLFVDPENSDEYARALEKALDTKWGDKPRNQAEKFSWDKIAEKYEELLNKLK